MNINAIYWEMDCKVRGLSFGVVINLLDDYLFICLFGK